MAQRITSATSLKQLMNLDDNTYLRNRLKFHAASRIAIQTGQALGQAMNTDGHNVRSTQVWTATDDQFIYQSTAANKTSTDGIATNVELVADFKATGSKVKDLGNGEVWKNDSYPAILLYCQCEMSPVFGSNGSGVKYEAYELKDGNNRIMDWVAPTSVKDLELGIPVPGYTARIEGYKGSKWTDLQNCADVDGNWALAQNNWEFAYLSGMVTFHPSTTPAQWSYTKLRITAFAYVGTYLSKTIDDMNQDTGDSMFSIRPYTFSVDDMTTDGNMKSIIIPGIVFNVFATGSGLVYGDLTYITTGNDAGKTRIDFDWSEVSDAAGSLGDESTFTAMAFVRGDGNPLTMLSALPYPFTSN